MRCLAWTNQLSETAAGQTCKQMHPRTAYRSKIVKVTRTESHAERPCQHNMSELMTWCCSTRVTCLDGGARHSSLKQGHVQLCQPFSSLDLLVCLAAIEQVVGHRSSNLAGHLAALCGALHSKQIKQQTCRAANLQYTATDKKNPLTGCAFTACQNKALCQA